MILFALVMVPALAAAGAYAHRTETYRTGWLVTTAMLHAGLVAALWRTPPRPALAGLLAVDDLSLVVLSVVSALFLAVAIYSVGYLARENPRGGRAFVSCLLAFLAAASLVALSQHLGLLWVGLEATTFALAPLIYHRHDRASLEAVWKYLVLSSVAIALALLGTFFLAAAQEMARGASGRSLVVSDLVAMGPRLHQAWLRAAIVFLLIGFGTKMGLVPLHTWKPDTYGEAPAAIGGLLAGGLTSCAFLGIARTTQIAVSAGLGGYVRPLLVFFGLISLGTAAIFMVAQRDLKRILAYSSVEHMGLLVLGLGVGGTAVYGSVLHVIGNGLAKGLAFLAVGNVVLATGTAATDRLTGLLRKVPLSGTLLLTALFVLTGSPPSGLFVSEFTILSGAIREGHGIVALVAGATLAVIFAAMAGIMLETLHGQRAAADDPGRRRERATLLVGPVALALAVIALGLYLPHSLTRTLTGAAGALGGAAP